MKYLIIFKEPIAAEVKTNIEEKPKGVSYSLPNEKAANIVMQAEGFSDYINKHGYHFNEHMANAASDMMINQNGQNHKWSVRQVHDKLKLMGITDYGNSTIGDITYLANMAYADFFPEVIKTEEDCIKYALKVVHDPDGYEGLALSRFIADLIGKKVDNLNWSLYI